MIISAFCTHCTGGSPPSDTDGTRQSHAKKALPSQDTTVPAQQNPKHPNVSIESEGFRVYLDPETGEFITPPEDKVSPVERLEPAADFSTSDADLVESSSPVPGGGTMVDLKGRFRKALTAGKDSHGKIKIEHQVIEKKD